MPSCTVARDPGSPTAKEQDWTNKCVPNRVLPVPGGPTSRQPCADKLNINTTYFNIEALCLSPAACTALYTLAMPPPYSAVVRAAYNRMSTHARYAQEQAKMPHALEDKGTVRQGNLGDLGAQRGVLVRVLQEVHHLLQLQLCIVHALRTAQPLACQNRDPGLTATPACYLATQQPNTCELRRTQDAPRRRRTSRPSRAPPGTWTCCAQSPSARPSAPSGPRHRRRPRA